MQPPTVPCPRCKAVAGTRCNTMDGYQSAGGFHVERWEAVNGGFKIGIPYALNTEEVGPDKVSVPVIDHTGLVAQHEQDRWHRATEEEYARYEDYWRNRE